MARHDAVFMFDCVIICCPTACLARDQTRKNTKGKSMLLS